MTGDVLRERTPFVIIELQLRPPIPENARPYWWGNSDLKFTDPDSGEVIWRQNLCHITASSKRTARVRVEPGFGWVLVLELSHDAARSALAKLAKPDYILDRDSVLSRPSGGQEPGDG